MRQSQWDARLVFDNARILLMENNIDPTKARLTQSYLRTEIAMSTGSTNISIPLVVTNNAVAAIRASEKRLNMQDVFVASELFIGVLVATSSTNTNSKLYTYENPSVFTGANVSSSILQLYNGQFNLLNDGTNILPAWDIQRHYKVQRTQQSSTTYYSGGTAVNLLDSLDGSDDGFTPIEPNWLINGAGNMQASIVLPQALTAVLSNSYYCVIIRGILAQNITKVN